MPFSDVSDSIVFRHDIEIASNCTGEMFVHMVKEFDFPSNQ